MAVTNRDRVGKALEAFGAEFAPYVDRRMSKKSPKGGNWKALYPGEHLEGDPNALIIVIYDAWESVFKNELKPEGRGYLNEVRAIRNTWAHQLNKTYSFDDTYRALDTVERALRLIDGGGADELAKSKTDLMRVKASEEARTVKPKTESMFGEVQGLKPWREVVQPHDDVAQGRFSSAEFAADLDQVRQGRGMAEYTDPTEFFRRTYLTAGLSKLLRQAVQRITGSHGAPPVLDLQTTFGGGKTHSMIALYHLFSGVPRGELPQDVQELLDSAGVEALPKVNRAVVVGTRLSPGQPTVKDDGTEVRTMWGELAWQIGGRDGYDLVADADRTGTNPGDHLRMLLEYFGPVLILIDEWVAYAAQLMGVTATVPGGTFDAQFYFAQALTEVVASVPGSLLVVSLPASVDAGGTEISAQVSGAAGHEALKRLRDAVGRTKDPWQPATAEESFEIVRRRLFKSPDPADLKHIKATARQFVEYYTAQSAEFPAEVREKRYSDQIESAYPVHPELFDRLYSDWSTLDRFQRTRGVLRLMAYVVHALWSGEDRSPIILPGSVPLDDPAVSTELISNLDERWPPIVQRDVDGPSSQPRLIDDQFPNLGKYAATRRAARTVFLGSAPLQDSANKGLEVQRIRLGSALPGEPVSVFADALSRLSDRATYLYAQGTRYWYGTQPGVGQIARDRAEQLRASRRHEVIELVQQRVQAETAERAVFKGVHVFPPSPSDVPDLDEVRLVVLAPDQAHVARSESSAALDSATALLDQRGAGPRLNKNHLVFLAADQKSVDALEQAAADYLAWTSIDADKVSLNLDEHNKALAATKATDADRTLRLRVRETFVWALVPVQPDPLGAISFDAMRVDGGDSLAVRAASKLKNQGYINLAYPPELLRSLLDNVLAPLWAEAGHVAVNAVWESLSKYPYLPRLAGIDVLAETAKQGAGQILWEQQGWGVATNYEPDTGRYIGLDAGSFPTVVTGNNLLVRPAQARAQLDADHATIADRPGPGSPPHDDEGAAGESAPQLPTLIRRFYGVVEIDPSRPGRDFAKITEEVIGQLTRIVGTRATIKIDIEATNDAGFESKVIRDVNENATTLKFEQHGFE